MIIRIIVVEDEPAIQQGIVSLIDRLNLPVKIVGAYDNGEAALNSLSTTRPHIIITDIRMPAMTGLELINQAKQQGFHAEYLILSGYADFEYVREALKLSVHNYLLKPPRVSELRESLLYLCQKIKQDLYVKNEQFLKDMIFQHNLPDFIPEEPFNLPCKLYLYNIGEYGQWDENGNIPDLNLWNTESILNFLQANHVNTENLWIISDYYPNLKQILLFKDENIAEELIFINLLMRYGLKFNQTITIISGPEITDLNLLSQTSKKYLTMLKQNIVMGKNQTLYFEEERTVKLIDDVVNLLYETIRENYCNNINLEQFARTYGYHQNYLFAQFTRAKHISPKKLLIKLRMEKAMDLLRTTKIPTKEVAQMVSYSDITYFSRAFKDYTGTSPRAYREQFAP